MVCDRVHHKTDINCGFCIAHGDCVRQWSKIGSAHVARAAPDGYTILFGSRSAAIDGAIIPLKLVVQFHATDDGLVAEFAGFAGRLDGRRRRAAVLPEIDK